MSLSDFVPAETEQPRRSGDARVDGLISGVKWSDAVISYGFPDEPADYERDYQADDDWDWRDAPHDRFEPLRWDQMDVVRAVLENGARGSGPALAGFAVDGFTDLAFDFGGRGTGSVDIRVANSDDPDVAYAFYPGPFPESGDVWFGGLGREPLQGNYDQFTILHEIGHALGLKHGHSNDSFGRIPKAFDSYEFSVMTYRNFVGANPRDGATIEEFGAPQSYMMLDIAALQHLYGPNFEVNSDDTVYSWRPGSGKTFVNGEVALDPVENRIFATIWDGGGHDVYDLSRYRTDLDIDLRPGKHSEFSWDQTSWLGGGPNDGFARGNIFNALQYGDDPRSLIEKAVAGGGDDRLRGNDADNRLLGLDGADLLQGGRGKDTLIGGADADLLMGGRGRDVFTFRDADHSAPGREDWLIAGGGAPAFAGAGERGGDLIDLRAIDADVTRPGNQAFDFGSTDGPGALWLRGERGDTVLLGSIDDDRRAEFKLVIEDGTTRINAYTADDFLL